MSFVSRSAFFLTTMHLWVVLTTMHLCVFVFSSPLCTCVSFGFHYAPLCFFLTTMHLFNYAPLCFFVTFSVLFVMYVCCVCVCLVFVSSNSSHSTSVMLTCQTPPNSCLTRQTPLTVVPHPPTICPTPQFVFNLSNSSHCGPLPPNSLPNPSTRV